MYTVTCPYCISESAHVIVNEFWDEVERQLRECQSLARIRDAVARSATADAGGVQGAM